MPRTMPRTKQERELDGLIFDTISNYGYKAGHFMCMGHPSGWTEELYALTDAVLDTDCHGGPWREDEA